MYIQFSLEKLIIIWRFWSAEEKLKISTPGPKTKLFESTKYVFTEVDMSTVRSQIWQYFIRDKKHGIAKCKTCDCILKSEQSSSSLNKHLKLHKIDTKSVETSEEPPTKKIGEWLDTAATWSGVFL